MDYPVGPRRPRRRARSCRRSSTRRSKRPAVATRGSATPWASACAAPRSSPAARASSRSASCGRSSPPRRSGASCSASPAPAPTSPARRPARCATVTQWIVNGSKIWTSQAHESSYGLLLARTDPDAPKHKGLTAFIVDMHEPGVEVRGIRSMAGASGFNEVFFTDSVVPDAMRVGEVGEGWRVGQRHADERAGVDRQRGRAAGFRSRSPPRSTAWQRRARPEPGAARPPDAALGRRRGAPPRQPPRARRSARRACPAPRVRSSSCCRAACSSTCAELVVDLMGPAGTLLPSPTPANRSTSARRGATTRCCRSCGSQAATIAGGTTADPEEHHRRAGARPARVNRGSTPNTPWSQIPRN